MNSHLSMWTIKDFADRLQQEDLIRGFAFYGEENCAITSITYDSRKTEPGSLFLCKGAAFREEYLVEAMKRGAVCYVAERKMDVELPYILVENIRKAQAVIGALYYDNPQEALALTGITGTKGKTTTAYYLKAIFDEWQKNQRMDGKNWGEYGSCGLLSTICSWDGKEKARSVLTTPEAFELYDHFRNAVDSGMRYMVMEVSSQALKYQRVYGVNYDVGIFLNISEDHISPQEHRDFEDYFSAKLSLFRQVKTACVNLDAQFADRILSTARMADRIITFGTKKNADIYGSRITKGKTGISFHVRTPDFERTIHLGMHGLFNVENALAAIAAAYAYKIPSNVIERALGKVHVDGRMEQYESRDGKITVIVDFAHNRLSFEKLYDSVLQEFQGHAIYTVFGCPGGKALNRRRDLGLIAGLLSRKVFLTADDPGMESAADIAEEIGCYMEIVGCPHIYIESRSHAIRTAIAQAASKNRKAVILVLGKGHETTQKFGKRIYDYPSDAAMVKEAIRDYDDRSSHRPAVCDEQAAHRTLSRQLTKQKEMSIM